jgi:hypothetical protein
MIEEAERNASVDKTSKGIISLVYAYDSLFYRVQKIKRSREFGKGPITERARQFFRKVIKAIRVNYKKNAFSKNAVILDKGLLNAAFEIITIDIVILNLKKKRKSLVIDITDDGE